MGVHMLDSELFKDHYGNEQMRSIFSDQAMLQKWIETELALAQAQSELGIISVQVYEELKSKGNPALFDMTLIRRQMIETSHPLVPFIRQFEKLCAGDAGEYIHFGATTQDILDTGLILLLRDGYDVLEMQLLQCIETLQGKTRMYRSTPMAGRTHGQHALPITFGFKLATYLSEMLRHLFRFRELRSKVFVGQLAGAAGTLASIGASGIPVQNRMMEILQLQVPDISWHTSRDNLAELVCVYGMIAATLGKMANEIINLQRTEIGEVEEGFVLGKVGSSTMPHKRNPMVCEYLTGLSRMIRNEIPLAFECMIQEHERDMGLWLVEWEYLPKISIYLSTMLQQTKQVIANMTVNETKMRSNLNYTRGLILSEKVMMLLAPYIGKQTAHELVYAASMTAFEQNSSLLEEICKYEEVLKHVSIEQLKPMFEPESYIGLSTEFVDRVLAHCI